MKYRLSPTVIAALVTAGVAQAYTPVAHWTFESEADFNNGVVKDVTGNGNDLTLKHLPGTVAAEQAVFSTDTADGTVIDVFGVYQSHGAIKFNGTKNGVNGKAGSYFQTAAGAPLNNNEFVDGYTVEAIFKLPADRNSADHAWMGILTREGKPGGDPAATLSISSLGEAQWSPQAIDGSPDGVAVADIWSFDLDTAPGYHHVAVTSDFNPDTGFWENIMYVDGVIGTRNQTALAYGGLFDFSNGVEHLWNVGLSVWGGPTAPAAADAAFNGYLDDLRISEGVVPVQEFTAFVPEPASLALLGLGGLALLRRRSV